MILEGINPRTKVKILADHKTWKRHLKWDYFSSIVEILVSNSIEFFCVVCNRTHITENALRNCLWYHREDTVEYYMEHKLEVYQS